MTAFPKHIMDHKAKIIEIMKTVCTLCKTKAQLALRQIKDWICLAGLLGLGLGPTYVDNHGRATSLSPSPASFGSA